MSLILICSHCPPPPLDFNNIRLPTERVSECFMSSNLVAADLFSVLLEFFAMYDIHFNSKHSSIKFKGNRAGTCNMSKTHWCKQLFIKTYIKAILHSYITL